MYVIFRIYFRPIIRHEQKYDQLQIYRKKNEQLLVRKQYKGIND